MLFIIFTFQSSQTIKKVLTPNIVVGVVKKEDQAIVGVFKKDNNGQYIIRGLVSKPILKKYHCFGFGVSCNFIRLLSVGKNGTQKYTLLNEITKVDIKDATSRNWVERDLTQTLKNLFTSISHVPRRQRRTFKKLLSKISDQFVGRRRRKHSTMENLLSKISKQFGKTSKSRRNRTFNNLLSKISQRYGSPNKKSRSIKHLLSKISRQMGGQSSRRKTNINKLLSKISKYHQHPRRSQKRIFKKLLTNISKQFGGKRRRRTSKNTSMEKLLSKIYGKKF